MLRSFRLLLAAFALAAPLALAGLSGTAEAATPQHRHARSAHAAVHHPHHRQQAHVKRHTHSQHAARARRAHRPVG